MGNPKDSFRCRECVNLKLTPLRERVPLGNFIKSRIKDTSTINEELQAAAAEELKRIQKRLHPKGAEETTDASAVDSDS